MAEPRVKALDILALTRKDNCRECGAPTCMVFAVQVVQGARQPGECPYIDKDLAGKQAAPPEETRAAPADFGESLADARKVVGMSSPGDIARRLDLPLHDDRVAVPVFGRPFEVDARGALHSLGHINPWVELPVLRYAQRATGQPLTGEWVPFAELEGGRHWTRFFAHRCEQALSRLAAHDPDLFCDVLGLFGTPPTDSIAEPALLTADRVYCLEPLPGVGLLFRCWFPDGDFHTQLSLLFDRSCDRNLDAEAIYVLTRGLAEMFTRIIDRHGGGTP